MTKTELQKAIDRQREQKIAALFGDGWHGGHFEFRVEQVELEEGDLGLSIDIPGFLRRSVTTALDADGLLDLFKRNNKADQPFFRAATFNDAADVVGLSAKQRFVLDELEGKSLEYIKKSNDDLFAKAAGLIFLMAVAKGLEFGEPPKTERKKPAAPPTREDKAGTEFSRLLDAAQSCFNAGDYKAALPLADKAAKANGQSSEALTMLGWIQYSMARPSDLQASIAAKETLKRALSLDDRNDAAHLYLGKVLKAENKTSLAATHFRSALALNPMNEEARREVKLLEIRMRSQREKDSAVRRRRTRRSAWRPYPS
ncbi:MAG: hypothetical protein M5R36_02350 [Deltaproteobacteria bacterium]|nr:hypothetical protein [Deltaproteobacteria bacterium]